MSKTQIKFSPFCTLETMYSRTPDIETADLSQCHASNNLSQFWAYSLFHRNSSTAFKNNCNMRLILEINYKDS